MRQSKKKRLVKKNINKMNKLGSECYICSCVMQMDNPMKHNGFTMDHVLAKSKFGVTKKPACRECNQRKAAMDIITLKKGTKIKVGGIPFKLSKDTAVFGESDNLKLTKEQIGTKKEAENAK